MLTSIINNPGGFSAVAFTHFHQRLDFTIYMLYWTLCINIFISRLPLQSSKLLNVSIRFLYFLRESARISLRLLSLPVHPHVSNCGASALTEWKSPSSDLEWHSGHAFSVMRLVSAMSPINKWWLLMQETKLTVYSCAVCVFQPNNICICPCDWLSVVLCLYFHPRTKSCSPECTCVWECEQKTLAGWCSVGAIGLGRLRVQLAGCWGRGC